MHSTIDSASADIREYQVEDPGSAKTPRADVRSTSRVLSQVDMPQNVRAAVAHENEPKGGRSYPSPADEASAFHMGETEARPRKKARRGKRKLAPDMPLILEAEKRRKLDPAEGPSTASPSTDSAGPPRSMQLRCKRCSTKGLLCVASTPGMPCAACSTTTFPEKCTLAPSAPCTRCSSRGAAELCIWTPGEPCTVCVVERGSCSYPIPACAACVASAGRGEDDAEPGTCTTTRWDAPCHACAERGEKCSVQALWDALLVRTGAVDVKPFKKPARVQREKEYFMKKREQKRDAREVERFLAIEDEGEDGGADGIEQDGEDRD
ncbi:hypothetical protein PsYK624_137570 [Phanerochaete sordida]|uniref:Uncharacterized protein n=1 Tax=Phanerochaete sordida TaxID=48140 RepID=A0A9P3GM53_9APHY|nr:hypothetical protein PsYK624_137570 [Phanerochaete sordida]